MYTTTIDVGNVTSYSFSITGGLTYFFALQAYDTQGFLSGYSAEVVMQIPLSVGPTISSLSPSSGPVGTSVTIAGANFGATKGTSTVKFNGVTATPTSWSAASIVVPVPTGATTGNVVVTVAGVLSAGFPFTVGSTPPPPGLPSPWQNQDVGSVGQAGSSSYSSGVFTIRGAGADIWGSADGFQFAYQPVSSDSQIVARVASVQNTSANAKAGVMFRDSLAANAINVMLAVAPNGNIEFMTRTATGGSTSWLSGATRAAPVWLRLTRSGSTFTGDMSADGNTWTTVGTTTVSMATLANAGLIVSSHNTSTLNTSTFDQVSLGAVSSGLPSPWQTQDVGSVGQTGSASYSSGTFTIDGAGGDIWGTADAFRFVHQTLDGDGQIVARVASVEFTNAHAKAGLMLRNGLSAGAANVLLAVAPDGNVEFMARDASGGTTAWLSGTTRTPPVWLRLTRSGSTISGAVSSDGSTWSTIGTTSASFPAVVNAGLIVSSHDTSQLNTSTFNQVTVSNVSSPGPLPAGWQTQDVGSVGPAGSATYSGGVFTVQGAGADIWGTADGFRYVYRSQSGDSQIIARVTGVQNTDVHAKAGVMLRSALTAGSVNVLLAVAPDGNIEFMMRGATNGSTTWLAGASRQTPVWLRLTRSGSTVTGAFSTDGNAWTTVGTATVSLSTTFNGGLVVSSHDTSQLNTSTFDNVQ